MGTSSHEFPASGYLRLALCQLDACVGDIDGNAGRIRGWAQAAASAGAHLALFPEQALAGYPAEDLLHKPHFLARCRSALEQLARELALPCLVGWPEAVPAEMDDHFEGTPEAWNAAAVLAGRAIVASVHKLHLPNYAVFDEKRYFRAGDKPWLLELDGARIGVTVCEDLWVPDHPGRALAAAGAQAIVNLSASPYRLHRGVDRRGLLCRVARECGVPVALCNQVGGQDELVFDGHSLVAGADGELIACGAQFSEELLVVDVPLRDADSPAAASGAVHMARVSAEGQAACRTPPDAPRDTDIPVRLVTFAGTPSERGHPDAVAEPLSTEAEAWAALRLGLGDYVRKNGFSDVVLGLSGGIDSALVMALAVDALGADRVHAVTMPSRYTSDATLGDAHAMSERVGVELREIPIEPAMQAFEQMLEPSFAGRGVDVTEENLQARIRGNIVMALSNKFGWLVLTTGNKSEVSVGYMTLYGDMAGGFAPIKDVPKTLVYELARWRNDRAAERGDTPPIPEDIITRPPSAELRAGQLDTDSLPPYEQLDPLLQLIVERDHGVEEAVAAGYPPELAERVQRMVDRAEYKRRQSPPGIRITAKAFGRDRRMPITNRFDGRAASAAEMSLLATPPG